MGTKMQSTTPFKEGQNTITRGKDAPKVKIFSNASQTPSADPATGVDHLSAALAHRGPPNLPSGTHKWTHTTTVEPVGANYASHVTGEFGRVAPKGQGQGVNSYGGAPNTKGDNPLGRAMNKVGEKSGYKKFTPKAGGKKK
jgi:hypothetical protein